jgi:pyrroloquinoline-quinone synthase
MSVEEVIRQCQGMIREKRNARHPFFTRLDRPLPKSVLRAWAEQKYHQVYQQNLIFSIIHSKSQHEDVRQWMMEQLVAEETPIACGSASHYNLMRAFAEACGAPAASFAPDACSPPVQRYVDSLIGAVRESHFAIGLLTIYAIESQSGESVGRFLGWLRQHYDFTDAQLEWFTVHSEDDDDHAERGLALVRKYAHEVSDFAVAAPRSVARVCDDWLVLHDYYRSLVAEVKLTMSQHLETALQRFRDLVNTHPRMKTLLKDWNRWAIVAADDSSAAFSVEFRDCQIVSIQTGITAPDAPIKLKATERTLTDIFRGELNPASELLDGRLQVTASDRDQVKLDAISIVLWD